VMAAKDPSSAFSMPPMMGGTQVVEAPPRSGAVKQEVVVKPKTVLRPLGPGTIPGYITTVEEYKKYGERQELERRVGAIENEKLRLKLEMEKMLKLPDTDRTWIGTLRVPNMGIGTIAWSTQTDEDAMRLDKLAVHARQAGLTFFDTAERYGAAPMAMIPAALNGVSQSVFPHPTYADSGDPTYLGGDCESNLARWALGGTVATKFTPTPWRRSPKDVVEAARASAARLGVEQLDLYQIHMPDIIQPFKRFGVEEVKNEVYWDGLAECYLSGLCKNVGVSNYGPALLAQAHAYLK
jgi:hypothetical protein